jgi:tRNA (mo5U34)-methyltransferase
MNLETKDAIASVQWWHSMDLGDGVRTSGRQGIGTQLTLDRIRMPASLAGKSVLDVGAWDGHFSFEAERRGAARVLATDGFVWLGKTWGSKAGFDLARRVLGSRVEDRVIDVVDISPHTVGTFDVVLFLGVLYHLRDPLRALDALRSVTRELLIIETHVRVSRLPSPPHMEFYGEGALDGDATNWWGPSADCVEAMLRAANFSSVLRFDDVLPDVSLLSTGRAGLIRTMRVCGIADAWMTRIRGWLRGRSRIAFHARP